MTCFSRVVYLVWVMCAAIEQATAGGGPCDDVSGTCQLDWMACSGTYKSGKCPGVANDIRCCIPYSGASCDAASGTCQFDSTGCSGNYQTGICSGPANIRCCVPYAGAMCEAVSGTCQVDSTVCSGNYQSGLCTAAGIECCVPLVPNQCEDNNGGCEDTCVNDGASYYCTCPNGVTLLENEHSCLDDNECTNGNGGCEQTCLNTYGSRTCGCEVGYELNWDGITCKDIDECETETCGTGARCFNYQGSWTCECVLPWKVCTDGKTCRRSMRDCPVPFVNRLFDIGPIESENDEGEEVTIKGLSTLREEMIANKAEMQSKLEMQRSATTLRYVLTTSVLALALAVSMALGFRTWRKSICPAKKAHLDT